MGRGGRRGGGSEGERERGGERVEEEKKGGRGGRKEGREGGEEERKEERERREGMEGGQVKECHHAGVLGHDDGAEVADVIIGSEGVHEVLYHALAAWERMTTSDLSLKAAWVTGRSGRERGEREEGEDLVSGRTQDQARSSPGTQVTHHPAHNVARAPTVIFTDLEELRNLES